MSDDVRPPVKATTTSFRVVESLLELGTAGVTELSNDVQLSKSSVHNHLETLTALGLAVKRDGKYSVSLEFLNIGSRVRERYPIYKAGRIEVERLTNTSGLEVGLAVLERDQVICLRNLCGEKIESPTLYEGEAVPLHCTAPGKAILSALDTDSRDSVLDNEPLEAFTENTHTDRSALLDDLESVDTRGLAFDREEWQTDLRGAAASITTNKAGVLGAIYVLGPSESMSGKRFQQDIPGLVVSAANKVHNQLYSARSE